MILLKSLIVLLLVLIVAQLIKVGLANKREGFTELNEKNTGLSSVPAPVPVPASVPVPVPVPISASQKAQSKAYSEDKEDTALTDHKIILNNSQDLGKLKSQVDELVKLGNEAKNINESFRNKY